MTSDTTPFISFDPSQLKRRTYQLGLEAVQGTRHLSDLLGDALSELRGVQAAMDALHAELERKEEALARLGGEISAVRRARAEWSPGSAAADRGDGAPRVGENGHPRIPSVPVLGGTVADADGAEDLFSGPLPRRPDALKNHLRSRIAGCLTLGSLRKGDRLPAIRELARRTSLNHKVVGAVYRTLARESLLEIRDRSGIYVAGTSSFAAPPLDETERWVAGILGEAVLHGRSAESLPHLLQQLTRSRVLRCACVESAEDDWFALCRETTARFGMEAVPVRIGSDDLAERIREADLVVTTPFHAAEVRAALRPGQPLVVASLHPLVRTLLHSDPETGARALICVDPRSGERLLQGLDAARASRVRIVAAEEAARGGWLQREEPLTATLAAWERLGGGTPPEPVTVMPYLAPAAVQQIAAVMVGLNRTPPDA